MPAVARHAGYGAARPVRRGRTGEELGVPVIDEAEFLRLLQVQGSL